MCPPNPGRFAGFALGFKHEDFIGPQNLCQGQNQAKWGGGVEKSADPQCAHPESRRPRGDWVPHSPMAAPPPGINLGGRLRPTLVGAIERSRSRRQDSGKQHTFKANLGRRSPSIADEEANALPLEAPQYSGKYITKTAKKNIYQMEGEIVQFAFFFAFPKSSKF